MTLVFVVSICFTSSAQDKLKLGVFGGFATQIKAPAAGVKVYYGFSENLRSAASAAYFFKSGVTYLEVNADGHYLLGGDSFKFYPFAGVNYFITSISAGGVSAFSSEIGANLGAGFETSLSEKLSFFAEAKYTLGNADKIMAVGGISFSL
ncbi:MAG: outer membrane beta-barrel protein [Bacteroidales bacterium]|nr:outer membrane beta-barrel protein [Bacteroidales bacterium]NPV35240.1 outer membrane beta-barrel protein [Bacteroidales bacterium]